MTLRDDPKPRHAGHLLEYSLDDELTLYDPRDEVVQILNSTAAGVWELSDGTQQVSDITAKLAGLYGLKPEAVEEDVQDILCQFRQAGLLHGSVRATGAG